MTIEHRSATGYHLLNMWGFQFIEVRVWPGKLTSVSVELLEDSTSESKGENDALRFSIISLVAKRKGFMTEEMLRV
jgi:hypothetical protein